MVLRALSTVVMVIESIPESLLLVTEPSHLF